MAPSSMPTACRYIATSPCSRRDPAPRSSLGYRIASSACSTPPSSAQPRGGSPLRKARSPRPLARVDCRSWWAARAFISKRCSRGWLPCRRFPRTCAAPPARSRGNSVPWCCDKELLREAARGVLPDAVRLRRKSPLSADPLVALLKKDDSAWVDQFDPVPELERFVHRKRIPKAFGGSDIWSSWIHLRPLSLNLWLSKGCLLGRDSEPATRPVSRNARGGIELRRKIVSSIN